MNGDETPSPHGQRRDNGTLTSERQRLLMSLFVSSERPLSTSELAATTGQTLGATAHHVRKLAADGYLQWAGERRSRGALQTFYIASEAGRKAIEVPRFTALLEIAGLVGVLPARPGERMETRLPDDWDEAGLAEMRELRSEIRPRIENIIAGVQARRL